MIDSCVFRNLVGQTITYNDLTRPLHDFSTEVEMRGEERNKMQQPGIWPHYRYAGRLLINLVGDLLTADSASFMQARDSDLNILMPNPGVIQRTRRYGTLFITFTGMEAMQCDVSMEDYPQYPLEGLSPSHCEFHVSFLSFTPYMTGASGRLHYV